MGIEWCFRGLSVPLILQKEHPAFYLFWCLRCKDVALLQPFL
jgi:hypothetical protein